MMVPNRELVSVKDSNTGRVGRVSQIGDLGVYEANRLVGGSFGSAIDANFWTATTSGAASASGVASGIATISSGTDNSGYGQLMSVRSARFIFAHPMVCRMAVRIPTVVVALNTRRWGMYSVSTITPQNGAYFELSAAGVLSVVTCSGATPTPVASGSFNGAVNSYTVDTNVHAYEVHAFTMNTHFFIDGVLVHTVTPTTAVSHQSLSVPIGMTSVNTAAGTTAGTLESWNSIIFRQGMYTTGPISKYQTGTVAALVLKLSAGNLRGIAVGNVSVNAAVTLWDNTAASGTTLWASGAMGANATPFMVDLYGLPFFTGFTLTIATAAANATVVYE